MTDRTPSTLLLSAVLTLVSPLALANADILRQEATAYARKGEAVVYRESHWRYRQDGAARRLVLYRCPDGRAFARKTVVERGAAQAPDFDFEDARDGYREGVRSSERGRVVYVRETSEARTREPVVRWNGTSAQRMSMKLDRWYGFVAPTMQLTYASADQRLLEFAGIATIRDSKGRHQDVRIVFPQPAAPATAQALQAALATPLVRACAG
jgi:hypothetical protein